MIILDIEKNNCMKKLAIFLLPFLFGLSYAQVSLSTPTVSNNKWTFGGGLGLNFGSNKSFGFEVAPRVGYRLTNDLEAGVMGSVNWQSSDYYKSTMVGVGPFVNYYIARSFYISGNLQHYFINYKDKYYDYKATAEETALYLGGGYMQKIGNNSYLQLGVMYNVLYKENNSIFSGGLVPNIGFVVGL